MLLILLTLLNFIKLYLTFLNWLYDTKELFEQVAREKGYKLPEPKSTRYIEKLFLSYLKN